jgi:hypothetical protein
MDPAELAEARAFTERVLARRLGRPAGRIFEVSATEALSGALGRDFPALVEALERLATTSGAALVGKALRKGVDRLAERLLADIDEQIGALTRPANASKRRLVALRACVAHAERSLRDLGPLLQAEQARLAGIFEQEGARFLERSRGPALRDLSASIDAWPDARDARRRAADLAQGIARQRITVWEAEVEPLAERLYRGAVERFAALVNGVLRELEQTGEGALSASPRSVDAELGLCKKKRFQFHELLTLSEPNAGAWLLDRVRGRRGRMEAAKEHASTYLVRLLSTNSARVANDLVERVLESRRRLESEVAAGLRDLLASAERSAEQARRWHAEGAEAVRAERDRLHALRERVALLARAPG